MVMIKIKKPMIHFMCPTELVRHPEWQDSNKKFRKLTMDIRSLIFPGAEKIWCRPVVLVHGVDGMVER